MGSPRVGTEDKEKGTKVGPGAYPELTGHEMRGMHRGAREGARSGAGKEPRQCETQEAP